MGSKPVPRRLEPLKGYITDPYVILPMPTVRSNGWAGAHWSASHKTAVDTRLTGRKQASTICVRPS